MKSELTQIREGNRRVRNLRIVAGVLALLLVQAVLGRMDSDARLAEVERIAALHHAPVTRPHTVRPELVEGFAPVTGGVL